MFSGEIPANPGVGFVAKSQNAPDSSAALLWVKTDGVGTPISLNIWLDGRWNEILSLNRNAQWVTGNWLTEQADWERRGFVLSDGLNGTTDLTDQFTKIAGSPTNYSTFSIVFKGRQIIDSET